MNVITENYLNGSSDMVGQLTMEATQSLLI